MKTGIFKKAISILLAALMLASLLSALTVSAEEAGQNSGGTDSGEQVASGALPAVAVDGSPQMIVLPMTPSLPNPPESFPDFECGGCLPDGDFLRSTFSGGQTRKFSAQETVNNLVIFITFPDEATGEPVPFTKTLDYYDAELNGIVNGKYDKNANCMKNFYLRESWGQTTINSYFAQPSSDASVIVPYVAPKPISEYSYLDYGPLTEASTLGFAARNAMQEYIPTGVTIDTVTCVFQSSTVGRPHVGSPSSMFVPEDCNYVLFSHEMGHLLGAPDLYVEKSADAPVGTWDVMANGTSSFLTYTKARYFGWFNFDSILKITGTMGGYYTINEATSKTKNCYKIIPVNNSNEYFMVEYREDFSAPGTLLVYRIDESRSGNWSGRPFEVEVVSEVMLGDTSALLEFSDGTSTGLEICMLSINGDGSVDFKVEKNKEITFSSRIMANGMSIALSQEDVAAQLSAAGIEEGDFFYAYFKEGGMGSVSAIGANAFDGCLNLVGVTFGSAIKSIGDYAFTCSGLLSVTIPDSIENIGSCAFYNCTSLSRVEFKPLTAPAIGASAFYNLKAGGAKGYLEIGAKIQPAADGYQRKYDDLIIDSIGIVFRTENTFRNSSGVLSREEVDDQLLKAGISPNMPFNFHAYFDSSVKGIGEEAFSGSNLIGVTLGAPPTQQGRPPLWDWGIKLGGDRPERPGTLTFGSNITSIGDYAFAYTRLTSLEIPDSVESIGKSAFEACETLYRVSMGTGLKSIGDYAFISCDKLYDITLGSNVETIGTGAFAGTNPSYIVIPEKVKMIGGGAFASCWNLYAVWFEPLTAPAIGQGAFSDSSNAQGHLEPGAKLQPAAGGYKNKYDDLAIVPTDKVTVYFLNNLKWENIGACLWSENLIADWGFSDVLEKWIVPEKAGTVTVGPLNNKMDLYSVTFNCNKYDSVVFGSEGGYKNYTNYTTVIDGHSNGMVYYLTGENAFGGGWQVDCYKYGTTPPSSIPTPKRFGDLEVIERPELGRLTIIGVEQRISGSFLAIPGKLDGMAVAGIAPGVFADTPALQRVIIPDSVEIIGAGAFDGCGGLIQIGFRGAPPAVGENAFGAGNKDTVIYYDAAFAKQWAPNGETTWNDCRIVPCVWGNPTGTGKVNAADAAKILRSLVELETLSDYQDFVSDVNWDGKVSAADAARILRFLVELVPSF